MRLAASGMWRLLLPLGAAALAAGCAGALPQIERHPTLAIASRPDTPLALAAREAGGVPGHSAVWPLLQGGFALDARITLIEQARTSLDLQYYLIRDDSTGRPILRALRDAALRGVRVRLLLDDIDTVDMDRLLLGLAATPNVEVRLFNPIVTARQSLGRRLLAMALDFKRLNHRMHNKLFVADGAFAVVGGRNLADEYFLRGTESNFIDLDVALVGSVVPELSRWFDLYWNSTQVYSVADIVRASGRPPLPAELARKVFDDATRADPRPDPPIAPDFFGSAAFSSALAKHELRFLDAESNAYADSPDKIDPAHHSIAIDDTLTHRFLLALSDTHEQIVLFSPYFLPGREALERIARLRAQGVKVRVFTNSLAISDEPLVSVGLERHQIPLLDMGVELYELSSNRLKLDHTLKGLFGGSIGRLHAKVAFFDRRHTFVGSMNLDPRSSNINTEIGVRIDSPKLVEMMTSALRVNSLEGVYQVKLRPNGVGVYWVAIDADSPEELDVDPDTSRWQRLRALLLSVFVPESQL